MDPVTGPLAQSLERQRITLNARFAAAQKAGARIDAEAFLAHLGQAIDPIVRALAAAFAEKVDAVTAALYDLSLGLFATNVLGPQTSCPAVVDAWRRLLPAMPRLVAREPGRVAASVTNAVHNVAATPGARPGEWIDRTMEIASHLTDVQALLDCGTVFAWRVGLVKCRDGALDVARRMEPSLTARALGLPEDAPAEAVAKVVDRLAGDRWITPADALGGAPRAEAMRVAARVGAFSGFGGPFLTPPIVYTVDGRLIVQDAEHSWALLADVFGASFQRVEVGTAKSDRASRDVAIASDGTLTWERTSVKFDELARSSSLAFDGTTTAVTIPTSHHVFLIARG